MDSRKWTIPASLSGHETEVYWFVCSLQLASQYLGKFYYECEEIYIRIYIHTLFYLEN